MKGINRRLEGLEREVQPKEPRKVVVDWDPDPKPAKPGEVVIDWEEVTDDDDQED